MTIGTRITRLRKEKGFTQEYLAHQIGISRQAVHKWEKDETSPDTQNLIALAQLLGTTVEYIAVGSEENTNKKLTKVWTYVITVIITAVISIIATVILIANRPVSFDAGTCDGGFATAVYDQYAEKLIEDNYFYLTRDYNDTEIISISPVRESRDVRYEGKAIYMSFDVIYTFSDLRTETACLRFVGNRKWIQNYEWRMVE